MATFNTVITNVSGSVGIGTTSVTSRLLVLGNSSNLGEQIATFKPNGSQTGGVGVLDVQNSGGSSILFVTGSGFVGVGISTPGVKLDVFAGGNTAARFVSNLANTNPTLAAEPGIILYTQNSTAGNYMSITNRDASYNANAQINLINVNHTGDGAINFVTRTSSTAGERVRITPAGRVGIGLTDPSALLANTNTADGIAAANSSGIQWKSTANDWAAVVIGRPASGNSYGLRAHSGGTTASDIPFAASSGAGTGTIRLLVTGAGNVGIGTLTPLMGLHVAASIGNPVYGGLDGNGNEFLIRGNLYYDLTNSRAQPITTGFQTMIAMNNSVGGIRFYTSPGSVAAGSISTVAERMVIDTSGLVGIGTTSPEGNLDVRINGIGGTVQSAWSSAGMPYSTYGNLTITQRHSTAVGSGAADGFGYAGPFIDLRAANGAAEWSVSQIMGVGDPFGTGTYNGGLAFLVSGGGSNDPTGRRNAGDAPQVRMLIGAAKSYISTDVGIGTTNPSSKLHVAGGDIRFNSTYGIIGATNTAGNVLRADGTRFVPAQLSYSDLSTSSAPVRTASYTSITGVTGDWFPIFKFGNNDNTGAAICTLTTAAHSSVTFTVSKGWVGNDVYSINVLNCIVNENGGYPAVREVRIIRDTVSTYDGWVEARLYWSSGPTVLVKATVMSSPVGDITFAASLATSAATIGGTVSVGDSVAFTSTNYNIMRAKGNIITPAGVGIGTTNPSVKLHVNGSGTEQFRIMGDGAGFLFSGYDQTNSRGRIGAYTGAAYTTLILNEGGGNVGVGTQIPNARLHVNGSGSEQFWIAGGGAGYLFGGYDQTNSRGRIGAYTGAAYTTLILNEGGGNVGIGLTNPDTNVSILRSSGGQFPSSGTTPTNAALRIKASANNAVYVGIDVGSPYGAWIQAADVTGFGATYPVLLNPNGGSVGIGTYNPSGVLEVRQTNNAGRTNVTFINPATASTSNRMRLRIAASGGFNGTDLHPYMEAYEENAGNAANGLAFGTYNGSALGERLRIDASGNVGIGKTNPAYPLDVTGTSRYTGIAYYDGGESINLYGIRGRFSGEAMHLYNKVAIGYPSGWGGDISTTPIYGLSTYGGAILAYNQGTVGIGTATSSVRLYVHGSSTATTPTMLVKEGVAAPTNGALAFEVEKSTGATIFAVSGSGFVGVGTSNPAGTFEVVGVSGSLLLVTDNLSGSLFSVNDVTGLPILEVFSDDTLIAGRVNTNALVVTGSSVGIGTSNTNGNRLAVNGQASITGSALPGADNTYDLGSSSPQYRWRTLHAVNISGSLTPTGATAGSVFFAGVSGQIAQDNANFFWDDANNRLGIGTATPAATLDVAGTIQVTTSIVPLWAVATNGSLRFREFGSTAANNTLELNVRPSSGKSGYVTFTEDAVADRWSVGIANGNGNLRFISGTPTAGSLRASLESTGNWIPGADNSQNLGSSGLRWNTLHATNISGSLTPTGATAGSVFFAGVSGQIQQDNASFFWDDTNNRLGIGTNSPSYRLHTVETGNTQAWISSVSNSAGIAFENQGQRNWQIWSDRTNDKLQIGNNSRGIVNVSISADSNVGIGTTAQDGYRLRIFSAGNAVGFDNQAILAAKNSAGGFENFLWPRWSDNIMYMNYGSSGFNIRNSSAISTMFMTNGGNVGLGPTSPNSKLTIGADFASVAGITVDTGGAGDSALIVRRAVSKPAFSVLPWDTEVYLTAGVYYDGTTWTHHSNSTNSQLFTMNPSNGVIWYASSDSSATWNLAGGVTLWDNGARWKSSVQSTRAENSYFTGGNVGVGTAANINSKITIYDSAQDHIYIRGTSTNRAGIRIDNSAGYQSQILFSDNGSDKWQLGKQTDNTFFVYDATATKNIIQGTYRGTVNRSDIALVPYQDGRAGIGTDPSTNGKLEIYATGSLQGIYQSDGTRWMRVLAGTTSLGAYNDITQANDSAIIFSAGSSDTGAFVLAPWATGTKGLRMDSSGQVGIGTATMTRRLVVHGSDALINDITIGRGGLSPSATSVTNTVLGNSTFSQATSSQVGNVAVGYLTLNNATTGADGNVAMGALALNANTSAKGNVGIGYYALSTITTASGSVAMGYEALKLATGSDNTAIGWWAGKSITTATYNVAIGSNALATATTSGGSTAVGAFALYNSTSAYNTAVGYGAGVTVSTGLYNTSLGAFAGGSISSQSNSTAVGYSALVNATGAGNSAFGYNAGSAITSSTKNLILGGYTGNAGGLDIRTSTASINSNNIILSDGDGNIRARFDFRGAVGVGTTTAVDGYAMHVVTGSTNDNTRMLVQSTGTEKAAGYWTWSRTADFGYFEGDSNGNFKIGSFTSNRLDLVTNNTVALTVDTSQNVGIGTVSTGGEALRVYRSSGSSVGVYSNTSTAALAVSGFNSTTAVTVALEASSGVASLGSATNHSLRLLTNSVERMRIDTSGRVGIGTTTVGASLDVLGGGVPGDATLIPSIRIRGNSTTGYGYMQFGVSSTSTNNWHIGSEGDGTFRYWNGNFGAANGERLRITSDGKVGIGTNNPTQGFLHVNGVITNAVFAFSFGWLRNQATASGRDTFTFGTNVNCTIYGSDRIITGTEFNALSDYRTKNVQRNIESEEGLRFIEQVNPVIYTWKSDERKELKYGFIAQDVLKAGFGPLVGIQADEKIEEYTDEEGFTSPKGGRFIMCYDNIVPLLSAAMRGLKQENDSLKSEIQSLKDQISSILTLLNNK